MSPLDYRVIAFLEQQLFGEVYTAEAKGSLDSQGRLWVKRGDPLPDASLLGVGAEIWQEV